MLSSLGGFESDQLVPQPKMVAKVLHSFQDTWPTLLSSLRGYESDHPVPQPKPRQKSHITQVTPI
jgi:hypothetical protein